MQHRTEMWAEYLYSSYPEFLATEDYDIENQQRKLEDRYEASAEQTKAEVMRATEEIEILKAEYKALCKESVRASRVPVGYDCQPYDSCLLVVLATSGEIQTRARQTRQRYSRHGGLSCPTECRRTEERCTL